MGSQEVAALLGVKQSRVRQLAIAGAIKGIKLGRDWFFTMREINQYRDVRPKRGRPRATPKEDR